MDTIHYEIYPNTRIIITVAKHKGHIKVETPLEQPATVTVVLDEFEDAQECFQLDPMRVEDYAADLPALRGSAHA
jgi:hypothetical protein